MAYKIGQLTKANVSSTITEIATKRASKDVQTKAFEVSTLTFSDATFDVVNTALEAGKNYVIRFKIEKFYNVSYGKKDADGLKQNIQVRLYNGSDYYTVRKLPQIPASQNSEKGKFITFELVFSPDDIYDKIVFVLSRSLRDYNTEGSNKPRVVNVQIQKLGEIKNLFGDSIYAQKIGVQIKPGTLLCINDEQIRVGRSGLYELDNGTVITSIGIAAPYDQLPNFILDYMY